MPSNFTNLVITWFKESFNYATSKNVTENVISLPMFTDTGSGEVNEAQIVLSGNRGDFISDFESLETPVEQYDRFRIQVTDLAGNDYDRFYEVKPDFLPSQTKGEGTMLTVDLVGIEYHTQQIHFNRAFWFADAFRTAREIGENYRLNRGSRQPELIEHDLGYSQVSKTGNGLPKTTVNHYEYGFHEEYTYNRWMDQADKLGGSVDRGGVLDFFDIAFETTAVNEIAIAIFSQGSRTNDFDDDASLPIIKKGIEDEINVGEQEAGIAPATGNITASWGAQKRGSYPTGFSKYDSGVLQFTFRPFFNSGVTYLTDAKVIFEMQHYKSKVDNNQGNTPPGPTSCVVDSDAFWQQIDMKTEFGNTIIYSEWTNDHVNAWINSGSNPRDKATVTDGTFTFHRDAGVDDANNKFSALGPGFWDCNIVINDPVANDGKGFFRTWVNGRAKNDGDLDALANFYAYSGQRNLFPRGYRILVDTEFPAGDLAGKDKNGRTRGNNIVFWDGGVTDFATAGEWQVLYDVATAGIDLQQMQCAVIDDGVMWFFESTGPDWLIQQGDLAFDCFHAYETNAVQQAESFDPKPTQGDCARYPDVTADGSIFATNDFSGVEAIYDTTPIIGIDRILDYDSDRPNGKYYQYGSWLCMFFPFSPATLNGESIGNLVGRGQGTSPTVFQEFPGTEPGTLTSLNMDFLSDGNFGWNQDKSEDYGPFQSLAFMCQIDVFDDDNLFFDGIWEVRVCIGDIVDNVVFADFEVPFVARYFPIDLPISSFQVYRGRRPAFFQITANPSAVDVVLPKELDIQNQFEWRNIKWITWNMKAGYDKFGRYMPDAKGLVEDADINNVTMAKFAGAFFRMRVDAVRFTKPLLAIARFNAPIRSLEPDFLERTHIATFDQLLNDANAENEKQRFQHEQYDIRTSGAEIFNLKVGDGVFFEDNFLTNREDNSSTPGVKSVKLVVKRAEFSITSPSSGTGGLTRRLITSRRFV